MFIYKKITYHGIKSLNQSTKMKKKRISVILQVWYHFSNLPVKDNHFHKYLKFLIKDYINSLKLFINV